MVHEQDGRFWAWTAVELVAAYDLTRRADAVRLDPAQRLAEAVRDQIAYVDRLLAVRPGEVVALRITRAAPRSLRIHLLGRVLGDSRAAAVSRATDLAERLADVPSHVAAERVTDDAAVQAALSPFAPAVGGLAQIAKRVRTQSVARADAGVPAYVAIEPFSREIEDWTPLLGVLAGYRHPISVTVSLSPDTVPAGVRHTLEQEATRLARLREPFDMPADTGGRIRYPADSGAALLQPIFVDALNRYADRAFRFAVTVASAYPLDETVVEAVGRTMSPAIGDRTARHDPGMVPTGYAVLRPAGPAEFELLRNAQASLEPATLPSAELHRLLAQDSGPGRHGLVALRGLVDRTEAPSLLRLPVALDGNVPGFRVLAPPDTDQVVDAVKGPSLLLGYQGGSTNSEVRMALGDLPRHAFIVGTPGSGKTNTALHLCEQLWRERVPFLVIEPVNAELDDYRWLATRPGFEDLVILTVGDESVAPLRLNPFDVPPGTTVTAHLSNLLSCFEAAFGLWDPLPFIYRRALVQVYRRRGFHPEDRGGPQHAGHWPVLSDLVAALAEVTAALGYSGDIGRNIDAAANLRAEALAEGACGPTLNCRTSFDLSTLLQRPVVVELAGVGDNAKEQALVTLLLLSAVRGHRRASRPTGMHVLLLEEAHRVFPRATATAGDMKEANAQALAAERIAQGLAEDRKYGQSYVLVDQQVGKVADDAYKITNLKVMHRTAASDDRQLLGATMSMHPDQVESAATLRPFEALVSHNRLDRAVTVKVPDVRAADAAARNADEAPLADEDELRRRFQALLGTSSFAAAMAPYGECHDCRHRCRFRRQAESVTADQTESARLVGLAQPTNGGWPALAESLVRLAGDFPGTADADALLDYRTCVFIHALRTANPPHRWTDRGREKAVRWVDRVRLELTRRPGELA
ncbi:ATP-binding protein [Dactylosporangium siamense]|uniref:ATP-binding protein n=1 Tax=Dactylosporangium siamense TaxID=685454 RepID=UPI001941C897|nr:ATP-binding protein [Dactylosporangium siamense]